MASSSSDAISLLRHQFFEACFTGDLDRLKTLVAEVASVKDEKHRSALHTAAAGGHKDVCEYLVDMLGLDINEQDKDGETPLLNAIAGGHSDTTKYFLDNGARPDLANNKGFCPLFFVYDAEKDLSSEAASSSGQCTPEIVEMLIESAFCSKESNLQCKTYGLVWAASTGNESLLKQLAEDIDTEGKGTMETLVGFRYGAQRRSLLHFAANEGKLSICQYLIKDLGQKSDVQDARDETPLLNASKQGKITVVSGLIEMGASCHLSNDCGFSPVHYAAERGDIELLKLLVSKGAKVDAESCIGTPLLIVASQGNHELVKLLLDSGANANKYVTHVSTPLLGAIAAKSLECVKDIISAGANVNMPSVGGVTALYLAASEGQIEIVETLLEAGADPDFLGMVKYTPLEIAAIHSHHGVVKILFPVTAQISTYSNWSLAGIISLASEEKAIEQGKLKAKKKLLELQQNGDVAAFLKYYGQAVFWYTKCLDAEPSKADVVLLLYQRSHCWAKMGFSRRALNDELRCTELKPDWQEVLYRKGVEWKVLGVFGQTVPACAEGTSMVSALKTETLDQSRLRVAFEARAAAFEAREAVIALHAREAAMKFSWGS